MSIAFRSLDMSSLDAEVVADASRLHTELLPRSPLAELGEGFLRRFYYGVLPSTGAIVVRVAYLDGRAAGLIAIAANPGALRRVAKVRAFSLFSSLACSIFASPKRIGAALRLMRLRGFDDEAGEILSFGVLPRYRSADGAMQLPEALYAAALEYLRASGARLARAVVDRDNIEARLFYAARAWRIEGEGDPAWPVSTLRVSKPLKPA